MEGYKYRSQTTPEIRMKELEIEEKRIDSRNREIAAGKYRWYIGLWMVFWACCAVAISASWIWG